MDGFDSQPTLLAAVRSLRRRLPGDPEFGDPVSTAGEKTLAYLAKGVAVLAPAERESVASELSLAGLQLWQSISEATGRGRGDLDVGLLYADVTDFSSLSLEVGDQIAVELLQAVAATVEACVDGRGGRIVRRMGDGVIASFIDAHSAVDAALDIQDAILGVRVSGYRPRLHTGVHWGRPRRLGGEYVGVDISIVAAVGDAARPGQVLASGPALGQLDPAFHEFSFGRRKRLRSPDAPDNMQIASVRHADRTTG